MQIPVTIADLLEMLIILAQNGKVSVYKFYNTLKPKEMQWHVFILYWVIMK